MSCSLPSETERVLFVTILLTFLSRLWHSGVLFTPKVSSTIQSRPLKLMSTYWFSGYCTLNSKTIPYWNLTWGPPIRLRRVRRILTHSDRQGSLERRGLSSHPGWVNSYIIENTSLFWNEETLFTETFLSGNDHDYYLHFFLPSPVSSPSKDPWLHDPFNLGLWLRFSLRLECPSALIPLFFCLTTLSSSHEVGPIFFFFFRVVTSPSSGHLQFFPISVFCVFTWLSFGSEPCV